MKILIVGSGLFGSVLARELTDVGHICNVIDRRNHVGGNCYTENIDGINIHKYGPHIFHTSNELIWNYLLKHTTVNQFSCRPKLKYENRIFSLPINLMTYNQLWGITTPIEAQKKIFDVTKQFKKNEYNNAEEWALGNVGEEIYNIFYKEYLEKQWNKNPKEIPVDIISRQVIRFDYNDSYYYDTYQGIPNYIKLFDSLLDGIEVNLNTDYLKEKIFFDSKYDKIIYTGAIDEFFDYKLGVLEYRSLRFENELLPINDFQGVFMVSYPEKKYEFTRIIEHKHFEFGKQNFTIITKEYPQDWNTKSQAYYPFNNEKNRQLYRKYEECYIGDKYIFGGRLGYYRYLDMDDTIELALKLFNNIIKIK
jgi:UDP-galactopyranose mutase